MNIEKKIIFKTASTKKEFDDGKHLFREYVKSLPFVLDFQDFEKELDRIEVMYGPPQGALLLAYDDEKPIACTGVRKLDHGAAELKRMFVEPEYRGLKIARQLLELALQAAKDMGYNKMKLDSIRQMEPALKLYRAYGFKETEPYCFNPLPTAVYMEKNL